MNIVSGIVLFAVIWFMVLFVSLPIRLRTQGDMKDVVPGTPSSAPAEFDLGKRAKLVTVIAIVVWAIIAAIILSGAVSIEDIDFFNRMDAAPAAGGTDG